MQTSTFQIIFLGICATLILIGVGVFASYGGFSGGKSIGRVVLWGAVDEVVVREVVGALREADKSFDGFTYIEKDPATYEADLVNAMANGTAPDLFILPGESIIQFSDKVLTIPYSSVSQSAFLGSFVDEGQIFLVPGGALALPFSIDPLVMYWNRDLFAGAGLANPPAFWNDFLSLSPKITSLDSGSNVKQSAVALGEWRNISHAKEILSALFMQAGDKVVVRGEDGKLQSVFGKTPSGYRENPAASALTFYSQFANPSKTSYAWNRSLPSSSEAFASGDLAVYFGFASEYAGLVERNPNLRFSVEELPQIEGNSAQGTYGKITGLAIPRTARNGAGALVIAELLSSKAGSAILSKTAGMPSVRRDVSASTEQSAAAEVFARAALKANMWLDPSPKATDSIFRTMVESVVSGKNQSPEAVSDAAEELRRLIAK